MVQASDSGSVSSAKEPKVQPKNPLMPPIPPLTEMPGPKDSPKKSILNLLLLYAVILGFGAIGGYFVFSSIYDHRCSDMMDEAEKKFNLIRKKSSNDLKEAMDRSAAAEFAETELLELRERLKDHYQLYKDHQSTMEALHRLEKEQNDCQAQLIDCKSKTRSQEKRLLKVEQRLHTIKDENKALVSEVAEATKLHKMSDKLYLDYIQSVHREMVLQKYGKPPYRVDFSLELNGANDQESLPIESQSLAMEINTGLDYAPTSVWVFLSSIEKGVYNGATFQGSSDRFQISIDNEKENNFDFFPNELNLLEETENCRRNSFGFNGNKGELKLFHTRISERTTNGPFACFGEFFLEQGTPFDAILKAFKNDRVILISHAKLITESKVPVNENFEL